MTQPDQTPPPPPPGPLRPPCYRHPDRMSTAVCRRCERPICWECMVQAPVGWQCTKCVREWSRKGTEVRYRPRTLVAGGITPVVAGLIALNLAVFLASREGTDLGVLTRFAMIPGYIQQGEWYRLLTATFLHENWLHIGTNMVSLYFLGPVLERTVGRARFLALYLIAGIGGEVCSYLLSPYYIAGLGASGAIFGLLGGLLVVGRHNRATVQWVTMWLVINLVLGFAVSGIDWRAHIGGFATGALVAYGFSHAMQMRRRPAMQLDLATSLGALGLLALLALLPPGHVNLGSAGTLVHSLRHLSAAAALVTMGLPAALRPARRLARQGRRPD